MMRDAIERAATDMFHSIAGGTCQFVRFDELLDIQKQTWRDGAKAAILAFLAAAEAPSDAVISDGFKAYLNARAPEEDGTRPALTYGIEAVCRAQVSALRREIEGAE